MKISFFYKLKNGKTISNESTCGEGLDRNANTIKEIAKHIEKQCEEYKDEIDFSKDNEKIEKLLKAFREELKNKDLIL
ncbi:hypothetical protein OW763_00625 [Clostridium aestuarii]|uniref:Uncharacterized protein n=1 Tax=Clostridium aestuarii TaxID=338193 RepID=A0ABT4CWZ2_9CLOT|nr:hypothetical protein [Clostridium aestuarii]MCY6482857.1 hypothetical protein [Clostridium aestuarii]